MDDLPDEVVIAAARAVELLMAAANETARPADSQLDYTLAALDLIFAIKPDERQRLDPHVPEMVAAWLSLDPEGWTTNVQGMSDEQAERLWELLRKYGKPPPG